MIEDRGKFHLREPHGSFPPGCQKVDRVEEGLFNTRDRCAAPYIKMFVSTNCLAFMERVTRTRSCPPQVQAFAETRQRSSPRPVKCLPFANQRLQAVSQQGAARAALLRGKHASFAQKIRIKFERDIHLH